MVARLSRREAKEEAATSKRRTCRLLWLRDPHAAIIFGGSVMTSHGPDGITVSCYGVAWVIRLESEDGTNRLNHAKLQTLGREVEWIASRSPLLPLIITGSGEFFSAGADLNEISELAGPTAYGFA